MTIVIDVRTATDHFPGIGRYAANLTRAMAPLLKGRENLAIMQGPNGSMRWDLTNIVDHETNIAKVPISPFSLRQQWTIPRQLRCLNTTLYHSLYYLMPYRPGIPTIVTAYDTIPLASPQYVSFKVRLFFYIAMLLTTRIANQIIAISEATARDLVKHFRVSENRIDVIPLAPDPGFKPQDQDKINELCFRLGINKPYVLYVGSNKPHKNLVRLIEAWRKIQSQSHTLVIAGFWDMRYPEAQERAMSLNLKDRIQFVGEVAETDLPALYSGAELFVFPSLIEGFGLPILEAMACGVSTVTSNTSAMPEVAGDAAMLINPYKADSLADGIYRLLNDKKHRTALARKGLVRVKEFTWKRCALETLGVYKRVMNK